MSTLRNRGEGSHIPVPIQALIRPRGPSVRKKSRYSRHRDKRLHTAPAGSSRPGRSVTVSAHSSVPKQYHVVEKSLRSPFETVVNTDTTEARFGKDGFWHKTTFPALRPASRDEVRQLEKVFEAMLADLESSTRKLFEFR